MDGSFTQHDFMTLCIVHLGHIGSLSYADLLRNYVFRQNSGLMYAKYLRTVIRYYRIYKIDWSEYYCGAG